MADKGKVLLVEDNPLNMKLAADLLEIEDFEVLRAEDGEKALSILKSDIPDIILLDIQLPGIDGLEVFKRIRADNRLDNIKVVALTAQAMKVDEERIRAAGFDEYMTKPIDVDTFVQTIKSFLGKEG